MSQPVEMMDGFVLADDYAAPGRPMSMRRALVLWIGLSAGGWGLIAACISLASL
jgi:hypothetical protein